MLTFWWILNIYLFLFWWSEMLFPGVESCFRMFLGTKIFGNFEKFWFLKILWIFWSIDFHWFSLISIDFHWFSLIFIDFHQNFMILWRFYKVYQSTPDLRKWMSRILESLWSVSDSLNHTRTTRNSSGPQTLRRHHRVWILWKSMQSMRFA